jgi:hypothetical protein
MRVTFDSTHVEGDFYEFNVASPDRDENGFPIHHRHAIEGSLHFETSFALTAPSSANPRVSPTEYGETWTKLGILMCGKRSVDYS